ncbi:MAG: hypothetical protein WCF54_07965 [Terracidiphilus sp.]
MTKLQTPKNPVIQEVGGHSYAVKADGTLGDRVQSVGRLWPKPTLQLATLSGLKEAAALKVGELGDHVAFHVVDYLRVDLIDTNADEFGKRHIYATAQHAVETPFRFNTYLDVEDFIIGLRSSFYFVEGDGECDALTVQRFVSNLESGITVNVADDGVSQSLEVKAGTVNKQAVKVPASGVNLVPWRTFRDVAPVSSKFLLRVRQVKDAPPLVALFEIDQKWKLDTMQEIGKWLEKHAAGIPVIA